MATPSEEDKNEGGLASWLKAGPAEGKHARQVRREHQQSAKEFGGLVDFRLEVFEIIVNET